MRAANPSSALALTLVDELVRHGLRHAVLAPGSRSAPLAIALAEDARIDLRVEIDERSAAFLALGVARATRRPAVVVTTSGTATANLHPAVVEADQDRVPLLVLTADRPPELRGTGANQTTDQVKLFGSSVRWFAEVGVPEGRAGEVAYWRSLASRAWAEAADGPVHLNLALRDPLVPAPAGEPIDVDGRADGAPWTAVVRAPDAPVVFRTQRNHRPPLDEVDRDTLAGVLHQFAGARGLVAIGQTPTDVGWVLALAERLGWPVLAEPVSSARRGEMAISTYAALLAAPEFAQAHRPDVVLRIGRLGLARSLLSLLGSDVPQVLVDPAGAWLDPGRALSHVVTADPSSACAAVLDAGVPEPAPAQWTLSWLEAEDAARHAIDALLDGEAAPTEPRTARDLAATLPDGSTLVVASSMPVRDLDLTMRPRLGLRVLANRGASGIDGFVSTALGVALASASPSGAGQAGSPSSAGQAGHPTAALAGDLSLLHDSNGFLVRPRPDLVMVVVNNDGGGIFSFLPPAEHPAAFERVFGTPHGVEPAALAALHGLHHTRLEAAADLPAAVEAGLAAGGVHLVEVRTERAANRELHRRLLEVVARAV